MVTLYVAGCQPSEMQEVPGATAQGVCEQEDAIPALAVGHRSSVHRGDDFQAIFKPDLTRQLPKWRLSCNNSTYLLLCLQIN